MRMDMGKDGNELCKKCKESRKMEKKRWSFKKLLLWITIAAIALFLLARVYYSVTDDFRISNITYEMPYQEAWAIQTPSPEREKEIDKILSQNFTYLGKGAQSYAFVSADDRYVIKFFKFKHLRPVWFMNFVPSVGYLKTFKEKQASRKERKLWGVFHAYKLAYDVDRNESGLEFIQLNTEGNPKRTVTLIDKIGLKRQVDLESIPFILQDKGQTLRVVLEDLLRNGDIVTAKHRISQIFDLYASEYNKGIYDHDHGVMRNTGFIGDRPIHLDVGKLERNELMKQKENAKKDAQLVGNAIKNWIKTYYPKYSGELDAYIDEKINELFG